MSEQNQEKVLKIFSPKRIALAISFGLAMVGYMFYDEVTSKGLTFDSLYNNIMKASPFWLFMSLVVLIIRDGGYMYRIRHLTLKQLSWKSAFYIIILWEFASAVTPSVVGGTAVAVFILNKEKIAFGKALAYVMLTAILDNLFFVFAGLFVLLTAHQGLFPTTELMSSQKLQIFFYISYGLIAFYTFIMVFGLFISPRGFKMLLMKITSWRAFRRWRKGANEQGTQMVNAARELKNVSISYWVKALISTVFIWFSRYFMLNCLVAAFADKPMGVADHQDALAKQVIMWIAQLVAPTPGAAGFAEKLFDIFFENVLTVGGMTIIVAMIWRLITHTGYLVLGAVFLPKWLKKVFSK